MRHWLNGLAAACILMASMPVTGQPVDNAAVAAVPSIENLIRELSDDNFSVREQATRELWILGDKALPALKQAAESPDPERAIRAREVMRKIMLHITPDTDPTVIELVEQYATASANEKHALMVKLRGKRAWRQMLKLYAAEKDDALREKLLPPMKAVSLNAARERLHKGDSAGALEYLELAPADTGGLLALAEFHRSNGTLQREIDRAKNLPDRAGALWRLALYRASGDAAAALEAALEAGEKDIAASMAALNGDPLPTLEAIIDRRDNDSPAYHYARIAAKRWQGANIRAGDLARLARLAESRDISESGSAINALFLLGETKSAEPAFAKKQLFASFLHLDSLERIPEALEALGIDPDKPEYRSWVEKRIEKLLDDDIENENDVSDIDSEFIALANFLERRGLHDAAREAYTGPLLKLADKDVNVFCDCLGRMFVEIGGAPRLGRALALAWTENHDDRWKEVLIAAFGDNEEANSWWDWLKTLRPDASQKDRFDAMLVLFDLMPDDKGLRGEWIDLLWKSIAGAPADQREPRIKQIAEMCAQTGDVENSLKAWEMSSPETRDKIFWGHALIHFSAVDRWDKAAELILAQLDAFKKADQEPGADLHAYAAAALRAAGKEQEAAEHDAWADKLSLGQSSTAQRIGNGYAYGGDYLRAAAWWRRAAMLADPTDDDYSSAMKLHNDALIAEENWPLVASTSEVLATLDLGNDYLVSNRLQLMRLRLQADTARALAMLDGNREGALELLAKCHGIFATDGSLADFFFPALRKAGLIKEHDAWFRVSWRHFQQVIAKYPESENTLNTAAWFATRAMRELDAAGGLLRKALAMNPRQAAYLDTMAEYHFARGERKKALEWSQKAINSAPEDTMIRRQHKRFRDEPFPK